MRSLYPLALGALVFALVAPTVAVGFLLWKWGGPPALSVFLLVPALAMLIRALVCHEPRPWAWLLFGAVWALFVWFALPVALTMAARSGKIMAGISPGPPPER
jgi:hypothetical protein